MQKANRRLLAALVPIILLCGCAGQSGADADPSADLLPIESTKTEATTGITAQAPEPAVEKGQGQSPQSEDDYLEIGFNLVTEEIGFIVTPDAEEWHVVAKFGEPERKSEERVWGADGLAHQEWLYPSKGLQLDMVREEGKQYVGTIILTLPSELTTARGIRVGSPRESVIKAYKDTINPDSPGMKEDELVAGTVYGGLIFTFENDRVTRVFIGAGAE